MNFIDNNTHNSTQASGDFAKASFPASIVLDKATKSYPGMEHPALDELSLEMRGGAVLGLVGPDGAGKTTLARMLAGLLAPTSGKITVLGLDPIAQAEELRAALGYMPQKFGLYEDLTVRENLDLYASLREVKGAAREEAFGRLLGFTGLEPFTARLAGRLSGGMKQKLGLACTLLGEPAALILDEPSVGVDPISRRELWAMVHSLAGQGMLILWNTSYLDEAEQCREVYLLDQGRLLFAGPPGDLTKGMKNRSFLASAGDGGNRKLLRCAVTSSMVSDSIIQGRRVRLILKPGYDPEQAAAALPDLHEPLVPTPPRFEDAFIDLLGGGPDKSSPLGDIMPRIEADQATVIEAVGLTKKFGAFTAADNVSFAVKRGEIFGLLGPNGAGKSTTFRMMCGLLKPSGGQALVLGLDLKEHEGRVKKRLGYMAQKFSLYGGLTLEQNLNFFSGLYGLAAKERKERIREMIDTFAFGPIKNRLADSLPLGFKQRLALSCAIMHRPEILFLDEPTSGVDPLTRREFWLHINGMVEKGVTVMVTTHFMEEAEYCDRIALVYQGKIIDAGPPDALKDEVRSGELPDPSMEDAFIHLIRRYDHKETGGKEPTGQSP